MPTNRSPTTRSSSASSRTATVILNPAAREMLDRGRLLSLTDQAVAQADTAVAVGPSDPTRTACDRPSRTPNLVFAADPQVEPRAGPGAATRRSRRGRSTSAGRTTRPDWGARRHAVEPVHEPRDARSPTSTALLLIMAASRSSSPCWSRRSSPTGSRRRSPGSPRPRRRLAEGDLASRVATDELSQRHPRAARAEPAVQPDGRPARGERRDHPPRPRPQPRLPRRREPRAAHADRRDAEFRGAAPGPGRQGPGRAGGVPRLVGAAARPARLAGPEPARAVEAGLRASCCSTSGRTTSAATIESAVEQQLADRGAQGIDAHGRRSPTARCGSATTRRAIGQIVTNLVGNALKFTPRGGEVRVARGAPSPTAARGSRSSTRAWASRPRSCPGSSTASTAAPRRTRRAAPAPASGLAIVQVHRRHAPRHDRGREPAWARARGSS